MFRVVLLLLALAVVAGCGPRTKISSFVDPAYRGGEKQFSSVAVFAFGVGLEEKQIIEDSVVEAFAAHKIRALRGVDVVPPTREYSNTEQVERIWATGVEAVLFISVGDKDVRKTYIPPRYYPGTTTATARTYGNTTYIDIEQEPGYTTGGYTVSKPFAAYSASIISVVEGTKAWRANATAGGGASHSFNDLSEKVARETVEQLIADGLF